MNLFQEYTNDVCLVSQFVETGKHYFRAQPKHIGQFAILYRALLITAYLGIFKLLKNQHFFKILFNKFGPYAWSRNKMLIEFNVFFS